MRFSYFYILLIFSLQVSAQEKERYKILLIDSISLNNYYYIEAASLDKKNKKNKKIFSIKDFNAEGKRIKQGKKYYLKLTITNLDILNRNSDLLRGKWVTILSDKITIEPNESIYKTTNLVGLIYVP